MGSETGTRPSPGFWGTLPGLITAIATLITALVAAGFLVAGNSDEGNGDDPTTPPAGIEMPDVRGQFVDDAIAELGGLGIGAVEEAGSSGTVPLDHVFDQDPGPGEFMDRGDVATLWVETETAPIL